MDSRTEAQQEQDAEKGNLNTFTRHLARQLMQQDSNLLMMDAAREARRLYARGVRDLYR